VLKIHKCIILTGLKVYDLSNNLKSNPMNTFMTHLPVKTARLVFISFFYLFIAGNIHSQTIIFEEEVKGTWTKANSPYVILRDVTVPADTVLIIEPGVTVQFAAGLGMTVEGSLLASGDKNDRILFTSADTVSVKNDPDVGWKGILIQGENPDTSLIENCIVQYVYTGGTSYGPFQAAINIKGRHAVINKCIIEKNTGYAGGAVYCSEEGAVAVINSVICNNSGSLHKGGIYISRSKALIANNLIFENNIQLHISGKNSDSDTISVINNTLVQNSPYYNTWNNRILVVNEALVRIKNCMIWNREEYEELVGVYVSDYTKFENCIIRYGERNIHSENSNIITSAVYDADPHFAGFDQKNYRLTDSSYAINSGAALSAELLALMPADIAGNPRVYDDDEDIIDIGAYELQSSYVNRPPTIHAPGKTHIFTSTSKEMIFSFSDVDPGDTHTLSVSSGNPDVTVSALSGQFNNATYTIDPSPGWAGEAAIILSVSDNHGAHDTDTFTLVVSDTVNTDITENTVWDNDTVFIGSNITVKRDAILEISEGTRVLFQGDHYMLVNGILNAYGSAGREIRFTCRDTSGYSQGIHTGWGGIRIQNNNDTSVFHHCIFEYVKNHSVLKADGGSAVELINCIFRNNSADLYCYYVIEARDSYVFTGNNLFFDNAHNRTFFAYNTDIEMYNNTFSNNNVRHSVLYSSRGSGIIKNSIFWNNPLTNSHSYHLSIGSPEYIEITNCIIEGGESAISYSGPGMIYESVSYVYPRFADTLKRDYRLLSNSPAVNKGVEDARFLRLGPVDPDGNDRIYSGSVLLPDVGAYEYQGESSNRSPVLEKTKDRSLVLGVPVTVPVYFYDADGPDTHSIIVTSDHADVEIQNLSGDTTGSVYTIMPAHGYAGDALISVVVEDNGGLKDSIAYSVHVDTCACGNIYDDMVWDDDTIHVVCDVRVEEDVTLTVNPGTKVVFHGPHGLDVYGTLIAEGDVNDTILFTLSDTISFTEEVHHNAWTGINIYPEEEQDTSIIKYCEIRYSKDRALELGYRSKAIVSHSHIHHNMADGYSSSGGGFYSTHPYYLKIENNFIHHNQAGYNGGGLSIYEPYHTQILNNTISHNTTRNDGAGIYTYSYSARGSLTEGNLIENNQCSSGGGGISSSASDTIMNNIIRNNSSFTTGGGIKAYKNTTIINNLIDGNQCTYPEYSYGGGMHIYAGNFNVINNLVVNNYAISGAGCYMSSVKGIFANNTICKNNSGNDGTAMFISGDYTPEVTNNIIWGNSPTASESQIHIYDEELQPVIKNNIIEDGKSSISYPVSAYYLSGYSNNFDKDPYFVDFNGNDYQLTDSSLCINAGVEDIPGVVPEYDIAGNDRVYSGAVERIDIGAYEYAGEPVNRRPVLKNPGDIAIFPTQTKQVKVEYLDTDEGDTHTITPEPDDPHITIENLSGDTTGSTYDLVASAGWQGLANIKVSVEDSRGLRDSVYYSVSISDSVCGEIGEDEVWDRDTVFVACDLTVQQGSTLIIKPGTVVAIKNRVKINVYGTLVAEGNEPDMIAFISTDTNDVRWDGIYFYRNNEGNDTSKLSYCTFKYGGNVEIRNDRVVVSHCNFSKCEAPNGGGIVVLNASPLIEGCTFTSNRALYTGGGISCIDEDRFDYFYTNPVIRNNDFSFNRATHGGAVYCGATGAVISGNTIRNNQASYGGAVYFYKDGRDPLLENNLIYRNTAFYQGGAVCYDESGRSFQINNTIVKNSAGKGGALYVYYSCPCIYNDILYYNKADQSGREVYLYDNRADPSFYNCFIQYGFDGIAGAGSGPEYGGHYDYNRDIDPFFADTANNNYRLSDSSSCINSATMNILYYQVPEVDIEGNPRVFAGDIAAPDAGAYEFQANPVNRKPYIEAMGDQYTYISQRKKLSVHFTDFDITDVHTLSVSTNSAHITVENISGNTSGSTYELVPENEWLGTAEVYVRVDDDQGKYDIDTFNLIVSEYYCGSITENTVWDKDTVKVACDVTVEENATLTIMPGTVVMFDEYAQLKVLGRLSAAGTEGDRIVFTSSDHSEYPGEGYAGWRGIRFYGPGSADTSELKYCTIQYAKGAMLDHVSDEYGGGLFFDDWSRGTVENCIISHNSAIRRGGGIYCNSSYIRFENNIISNNSADSGGGGIYTNIGNINPKTYYLVNSIICNNSAKYGGGIYCNGVNCYNSIIAFNDANYGGGMYVSNNRSEIINSVFRGNEAHLNISSDQIALNDLYSHIDLFHNVIENGLDGIDSHSAIDSNECLITEDPRFISPSAGAGTAFNGLTADWSLAAGSSCINRGTIENGKYFEFLPVDIHGEERILMDTIDIGPYEFRNISPLRTGKVPGQQVEAETTCNISIPVNNVFSDGNTGDTFTYHVSAIDQPAWLDIEMISGNIHISGTPVNSDTGTTQAVVVATDLFGAEARDTFSIEVLKATEKEEEEEEKEEEEKGETFAYGSITDHQVTIFPVPAGDVLNIRFLHNFEGKCTFEIIDIHGRILRKQNLTGRGITVVDVSSIPAGTYQLVLQSENEYRTFRIAVL